MRSRNGIGLVLAGVLLAGAATPPLLAQGQPLKIGDIPPVYPEAARLARIRGTVLIEITVGTDGRVSDPVIIRSIPKLDEAALTAVRQWRYEAITLRQPTRFRVRVSFPPRSPARVTVRVPPQSTRASLCASDRPARVPPRILPTAFPSAQEVQREIQQLSGRITSGTLDGDACLDVLGRRGYLYAIGGLGWFAKQDLDAVIAHRPDDRDALFSKGLASFLGHAQTAVSWFSRVIEVNPRNHEAYFVRGWANLVAANHQSAVSDFDRALNLAPDETEALRGRAWALVHLGEYDRAVADVDRWHARAPHPEAVALRGVAHYLAGRDAEARRDLRSAMRFRAVGISARSYGPLRIDNWYRHRALQQRLEARAGQDARDVTGWLAAGVIGYRSLDDLRPSAGGVSAFDKALAIAPGDVDALMMRAAAQSGPYFTAYAERAIADLSEVVRLHPDYAEAYVQRSILYATDPPSLGLAVADCEKALALVPGDRTLEAMLRRLRNGQAAWLAQQQRAAELQAARAAALESAQEQAAAAFLGWLAAVAASGTPPPLTYEERQAEHTRMMNDWLQDLATRR
jgi:TonB family protein